MSNTTDQIAADVETNSNAVVYAVVEETTGAVVNIVLWDGIEEWSPAEGLVAIKSDEAQIGWTYAAGQFSPPPVPKLSPEEILARNTLTRDSLLAIATLAISPLQDAVDLDDATAGETALLKKWKQYRVAVNRMDLTLENVPWPDAPA